MTKCINKDKIIGNNMNLKTNQKVTQTLKILNLGLEDESERIL